MKKVNSVKKSRRGRPPKAKAKTSKMRTKTKKVGRPPLSAKIRAKRSAFKHNDARHNSTKRSAAKRRPCSITSMRVTPEFMAQTEFMTKWLQKHVKLAGGKMWNRTSTMLWAIRTMAHLASQIDPTKNDPKLALEVLRELGFSLSEESVELKETTLIPPPTKFVFAESEEHRSPTATPQNSEIVEPAQIVFAHQLADALQAPIPEATVAQPEPAPQPSSVSTNQPSPPFSPFLKPGFSLRRPETADGAQERMPQ